ncbi:ComF family protein [Aureimonas populi]|uniref:ComF family protein n=1 Tax=Aureimonas populi TaxID=1701758 RepID=A0ABW5CL05_9HYPH|nr:ComF family protein [Aureimonas populi]
MRLRDMLAPIGHFFYPPICPGCEGAVGRGGGLCPGCWSDLAFIERPFCEILCLPFETDHGPGAVSPAAMAEPPAFGRLRAAVIHRDLGARLVSLLKYGDRTDLAPLMAGWMARAGADLLAEAELVVPVPLHRGRLFRRRFNQSADLARRVAGAAGLAYRPLILARVKATRPQVGLGGAARRRNLQGAFAVAKGRRAEIEGRRILLVDDVFTTGTTVSSAAAVLRRAGAAGVDVLTFSRVAQAGA